MYIPCVGMLYNDVWYSGYEDSTILVLWSLLKA